MLVDHLGSGPRFLNAFFSMMFSWPWREFAARLREFSPSGGQRRRLLSFAASSWPSFTLAPVPGSG